MSERHLRRRELLAAWLYKRDTVQMEKFLIGAAIIIGWRVVDVFQGKPVAPLTTEALFKLSFDWWWCLLTLNAALSGVALVHGQMTGNTFRLRGFMAFAGSLVWTALFIAVLTSEGPFSVAVGYAWLAWNSWETFIVLMVKADVKKNLRRNECGSK